MAKAIMQKWQRDWFKKELDRQYDPLIDAAELKLKSIEADAVEIAEKNLVSIISLKRKILILAAIIQIK